MGAHHLADTEPARLTRVAGRGALVASTALALTGSGAGLALAHTDPGDGHGGGSGHGSGHGNGHGNGHRVASSAAATCDPELASRLADGLLGDLGLTSSPEQLCAGSSGGESSSRQGSPDQSSSGHGSSDQGSSASSAPGGSDSTPTPAPARTAAAPAMPTNPVDIPPAPGEVKTIDLPDRPSGHSGRRT
jgi:hypothetical protein